MRRTVVSDWARHLVHRAPGIRACFDGGAIRLSGESRCVTQHSQLARAQGPACAREGYAVLACSLPQLCDGLLRRLFDSPVRPQDVVTAMAWSGHPRFGMSFLPLTPLVEVYSRGVSNSCGVSSLHKLTIASSTEARSLVRSAKSLQSG